MYMKILKFSKKIILYSQSLVLNHYNKLVIASNAHFLIPSVSRAIEENEHITITFLEGGLRYRLKSNKSIFFFAFFIYLFISQTRV